MVRTVAQIEAEARARGGLSFAPAERRIAVVADFAEEGWPSMDQAAELTALAVARHGGGRLVPALLRPALPRLARRLPGLSGAATRNADRYLGRYLFYPRWLGRRRRGFALFHLVDQSYAHLVHALPASRCVVTCHDLDAFRSLGESDPEPRPWWFRATMRRVLGGLQSAAQVICDSAAVRDELLSRGLVPAERLSVVPLPVHPDFSPQPSEEADAALRRLLGPPAPGGCDLLHVGANMPRKNLPLLLRLFALVRAQRPAARLLRVGGPLDAEQRALARALGVEDAILELPYLERPLLAALYRHARVLLLPSAREGFGWPLLEAMACGTLAVASDLPPLRELAGEGALLVAGDDPRAWAAAVAGVLDEAGGARRREALRLASRHSGEAYAQGVTAVYRRVLGMPQP